MIYILPPGSIGVGDICWTTTVMLHCSSLDTNSVTFFVLQSPIIPMYENQAFYEDIFDYFLFMLILVSDCFG